MTTTAKAKTAKTEKPAAQDAFAIPAMPAMEVPPAIRDMAENTVAQGKEAYEKIKSSAEETTAMLGESIEITRENAVELNSKMIEAAQANTDAAMSHAKEVLAVKSFAEVIELQTAFVKTQMNILQDQTKAFQDLTAKIAEENTAPYKDAMKKTADTFKIS